MASHSEFEQDIRRVDNVLDIGDILRQMQVSELFDSNAAQVDSNDRVLNKARRAHFSVRKVQSLTPYSLVGAHGELNETAIRTVCQGLNDGWRIIDGTIAGSVLRRYDTCLSTRRRSGVVSCLEVVEWRSRRQAASRESD